MLDWLKGNKKTVALIISIILNLLGGTGTIPPVVGGSVVTAD